LPDRKSTAQNLEKQAITAVIGDNSMSPIIAINR
jgi:hypothetical protein